MYSASAAAPSTLAGARLMYPTLDAVSGTTNFEADLAQSSPASTATVAFTLYRLIDGSPETGKYCFLSPNAINISGTTRWSISNVDTRTITGNCSSSQTFSGTLKAPKDGTYRFGIWINGIEYITPDSVTIENGNSEDPDEIIEEPPANQNTNTTPPANTNTPTNTPTNTATNTGTTTNTNAATNTPAGNTNTGGTNTTTNLSTNSGTNVPISPSGGPQIRILEPRESEQIRGSLTFSTSVTDTSSPIDTVIGFLYTRGVWYTMGTASNTVGSVWSVLWDSTRIPDGSAYLLMRVYLSDGTIYASSQRSIAIANATGTTTTNSGTTTNTGSPMPAPAPELDSDADGVSDTEEILAGTDPHRPPSSAPRRRPPTPRPLLYPKPVPATETDTSMQILQVIGPGVTTNGDRELADTSYIFSGMGTAFDYLTLFIASEDSPVVIPVFVDESGRWEEKVQFTFEPGTHGAHLARLDESGEIDKQSAPFSFTIEAEQLNKDLGGGGSWVWILVGIAGFLGIAGGIWLWSVYKAGGESGTSA